LVGTQNPTHTYLSSGVYQVTLVVTNSSNCTDSFSLPITIYPSFSSNNNVEICQGDSIFIGGAYQNASGTYTDSLQTINGCDSIYELNLQIQPTIQNAQTIHICQGDSVLIQGNYQNNSGSYSDTSQSTLGCDSISITILIVDTNYNHSNNVEICHGDSIFIGGAYQNVGGTYIDSLQTINGCDSVLVLNLQVVSLYQTNQFMEMCEG